MGVSLDPGIDVSVIIPVMNEKPTVQPLVDQICDVFTGAVARPSFEILIVDDGSTDGTWEAISGVAERPDSPVKALRFRRNFGKASALDAGFRHARGAVVVTMDGDLQDDPKEIPRFLEKIQEGYDVVSGWKTDRKDPVAKVLPSRFFNWVTRTYSGVELHDFNCGFKAYRSEVTRSVRLYGDLHRYVPVLADDLGFKVGEIAVEHHARAHGASKYGWSRLMNGFVDLLTVITITRFLRKPAHLFGGLGISLGIVGFGILSYLSLLWFAGQGPIGNRPLFFLGILSVILSANLVFFGMLAELLNRKLDAGGWDYHISETKNVSDG